MALKPIVIVALIALEGGAPASGLLTLLVAGGFALAVLRRRRRVARLPVAAGGSALAVLGCACACACALGFVPAPASAQAVQPSASAQGGPRVPASGPLGRASATSPRWMYVITGGYTYPDLDDYAAFYGDDRDTSYSVAGAYRLRDWLEVGGRIGLRDDKGIGLTPEGATIPDAVELTVVPAHVFADFIYEPRGRRWAAYAGVGVGGAWYRQEVQLQQDVDGRTDIGGLARVGWRLRFLSSGSRESAARRGGSMFTRSFVLIEAEHFDAEADGGIELGGTSYHIGVRFEFEL